MHNGDLRMMLLFFRSFNFDAWRRRFNEWVDQQKLRVSDLFRRFDSNHDGMLTREEFMKGLKASGTLPPGRCGVYSSSCVLLHETLASVESHH